MTKYLISALCAAVVPGLFWLGGFNFDTRGEAAILCATFTIVVYGLAVFYPGWKS